MTKHSGSKHLKRLNAPKTYPITRKIGGKFTVRPDPGPHPSNRCIPLGIVLRNVLGYARTIKEAKHLLREGKIEVDKRIIKKYEFPVGLMDVISIRDVDEHYRVLPFRGRMVLHQISEEESNSKILAITGKRPIKGGNVQISLEDGRNLVLNPESEERSEKVLEEYELSDSLHISLPDQDILDHFRLKEGNYCLIVDGEHMGKHGSLREIKETYGPKGASTITIETSDETESFTSAIEYALILGEEESVFSLPSRMEDVKLRSDLPDL